MASRQRIPKEHLCVMFDGAEWRSPVCVLLVPCSQLISGPKTFLLYFTRALASEGGDDSPRGLESFHASHSHMAK